MSAELSSLGIAQIVESAIADYDLHDENGNELTDDLYVIRSEQLDELGLNVARRIHKAIRELEAQGKTGFSRAFDGLRQHAGNHREGRRPHLHAALRQLGRGGGHYTAQQNRVGGH
jgi:hypothetical protein